MAQTIVINSKGDVSPKQLSKAPADVVVLRYDFGLWFGSSTASTLTVTADSGLTVGTTSVASNIATVPVSAGDDGYTYDLKVKLSGASETKEVVTKITVQDITTPDNNDYGFSP